MNDVAHRVVVFKCSIGVRFGGGRDGNGWCRESFIGSCDGGVTAEFVVVVVVAVLVVVVVVVVVIEVVVVAAALNVLVVRTVAFGVAAF